MVSFWRISVKVLRISCWFSTWSFIYIWRFFLCSEGLLKCFYTKSFFFLDVKEFDPFIKCCKTCFFFYKKILPIYHFSILRNYFKCYFIEFEENLVFNRTETKNFFKRLICKYSLKITSLEEYSYLSNLHSYSVDYELVITSMHACFIS